ncbi:MAG: LytTR family DNA-binding domain-containing protein [Bacteroidales bacterium]|nr:LytTR family DNA-binding domain-containing protein [Bacteroidales bacterium]
MYKVLIVDDEFLARKLLQGYVSQISDLEVVGTAANAAEAFKAIKEHPIDIMLLDIHMPDLNGIDFARTCKSVPAIIFTTAYSEYALASYEVSAIDYLLKPIALPRFIEAIDKAKQKLQMTHPQNDDAASAKNDTKIRVAADAPAPETVGKDYMLVKADYKLYKINFDELLYIEGQHEYVSFYTKTKRITALYALKALEEQLPADRFIRVHKSYIVAISLIQEIEQTSINVAGVKIPVGGIYRDAMLNRLGAGKI